MAVALDDCLQSLQALLGNRQTTEQVEILLEDIKRILSQEILDKDIDYACSLLFDKQNGITRFLQKTADSEQLHNGKVTALNLLSELIQKVEKKIQPYAIDIKEACMAVYSRDRFAKVKNAAIPVLIKLLEVTAGCLKGEDFKIDMLIQKFFIELTKASKLPATVKASIYNLLGIIAEVFPDLMTPYSEKLVGIYVNVLKVEMTSKTKKPEFTIIAGCLEGLAAYMFNFTQSYEEGSKHSYEIFKYARMVIDPSVTYTKYDVPKAGLKLFTIHAGQFRHYLVEDYKAMYEKLQSWSRHNNKEVLHIGVSALEAFVKEVSEELVERGKRGEKDGAVFKFFLLEFRGIMNNKYSTSKQVSLAIRGYGLLAAPCRTFLSEADTQFMLAEMINKCEHQSFSQDEEMDEKLMSIPSYLTSLANIVRCVDSVSEPHALVLERLIVLLLEHFPKVTEKMQFPCIKSILLLLLALMSKATVFQKVLSSVVYQGLIRTCSHLIVAETSQIEKLEIDISVKTVSYRDYISLWKGLLSSVLIKDFAGEDFTIADRKQLTKAVYNELMGAVQKVLNKLDFEARVSNEAQEGVAEDTEVLSADPTFGVTARKPKDFQVFINVVDLCKDLLINNHTQLFSSWVFTFTHSLIVLATRYPLVSGFYKLLSVTMNVASKLNYFKECSEDQPQSLTTDDESMEVDKDIQDNVKEKDITYQLIKKFSHEVLVRMKQYRDELLASCLILILSLPKEIIADQIKHIVPAIQTTFTLGLSYLPLANIGLDALEYWCHELPSLVLEPHYTEILPCLDAYLVTDDRGLEEASADSTMLVDSKKSGRRSKIPVRLVRNKNKGSDEKSSSTALSQVKQRILCYLGSLGGQVNHALLSHSDEDISQEAIAWDTQKHLRFDVPFFDMKPVIYFDSFLPQVVKLAQKSSDRQTKVAACELLHSLVLYALGRGAQMPGETQQKHPMEQLYRKLFPAVLSLACDVEQVCKELFEPLMMQLIHWFTNNKMAESPETMALLDTIYDALIQPSDSALRDFGARCLREFLQWSLKQTSKKAAEKNPINAKSVLKRLYSYALHPSTFKRLGAALAFNNIYMVFREEDALVDRFTFEILVHFVESLALAHDDDKSLGTQKQCIKALDHLERIIKKKADILKKDPGPKQRPEPSAWNGRKLDFALRWLTRQCGNPQTECRHACMKLVLNLCTLLQAVKSPKNFFAIIHKAEGAPYFLKRFEGGGSVLSESHGLLGCPTMNKQEGPFTIQATRQWFDMLLAALDCYCWVFGENLMVPSQLFDGEGSEISCIFKSLAFFIDKLASYGIEEAAELFQEKDSLVFTPQEKDDYNRLKCTVIIRMWNFLSVLLEKHSQEAGKVVPSKVWTESLWKLLCDCVVRPSNVGFNMADTEIMLNLPQEMKHVLVVMTKYLPAPQMKQFKSVLAHQLAHDCNVTSLLPLNLTSVALDHLQLMQMIEGYRQLHVVKLLVENLLQDGPNDRNNLALQLFDNVFQGIVARNNADVTLVDLNPTAKELAKSLLTLALELGLKDETLVNKILDKTAVQGFQRGTEIGHGDLFFTTFSSTLAAHFATAARNVPVLLMEKAKTEYRCVGSVLVTVLDHVARDRHLRKKEGLSLCGVALDHWTNLRPWWGEEATQETESLALLVLSKILLIDSQFARDSRNKSFIPVFEMYQSLLKDARTTMAFKNQALDLLPFFASLKGEHEDLLKDTLNRFIADNFPLKSAEFSEGTHKYKDYISAIDKLLMAMEMTGSSMLLEILISVYCREQRHAYEDAIQKGITRYVQRLPLDQQRPVLDVPYAIFSSDTVFQPEIRKAVIEQVCLPMLRQVSVATVNEFFANHISELVNHIDVKLNKNNEAILENQLMTKISSFQLLELMYARLTKSEVNSESSVINQRFCLGKAETGKEMTQRITKCAHEAKSEDTRGETLLLDLRRQYHCHAYNLMIAIISCVQTDVKFYKAFLFQDNITKGQFLIDNIIDENKKYEFKAELESPMERRKRFVSIRNEAKEKRAEMKGGSWDSSSSFTPSIHLASQYLADSSLRDDLNQYDFNMSSTEQAGSYNLGIIGNKSSSNSEETDVSVSEDYVELEMDALNQHECMASLIALIKHMAAIKISPEVPKSTIPKDMPQWMPYLCEKMTNPSTHINVKLFIAKLVMNCSQTFQPYAKFWLRPLCQLLFCQEVSGEGINYFLTDLIVTMMSWHTAAIPEDSAEERAMASRVVKIIIANIYHPSRQVFRNNLELLKTLLECWHDRIEIPYDVICNLFSVSESKSLKPAAGIQVLGVVLTGKFHPYGPSASVSRESYLSTLVNLMSHHLKIIYAATAEVIGLILHHLASSNKETEGSFHDSVVAALTGLSNTKVDNFITCMHSIHKHYLPITERFVSKLLFLLPSIHGQFRTMCLEIIQGHIEKMDNAFLEINSQGLPEFLKHRDVDTQLMALKIVQSLVLRMKSSELLSLLPAVTSFSRHSSPACRIIMLEILIWTYDYYRESTEEEIMAQTKEALLRGLCDEDPACRVVCQNFWSSSMRLPESTLDRTVTMLEVMYSTSTETHFLAYATNLLLEATSKSPDYQRAIFEHALSECKFQDYSVHSSWRQRHAAMTPLFASTLVSQSIDIEEEGVLKATQDVPQFTATLDVAGSGKAFNWLTQSTLDTFTESGTFGGDSQLLFIQQVEGRGLYGSRNIGQTGPGARGRAKKTFTLRRESNMPSTSSNTTDESTESLSDVWRLKRRFIKDQKSQTAVYFAKRNSRINMMREEALKEQKTRRENQVTLYRKYRIGDLPDIQIKYQYIIAPLQALAHRDSTVAKLLFSSLFQGIFSEMDKVKTEREMEETISLINKSIENILSQSVDCFPPFLGCILTILYELRSSLKVPISELGSSAIASNQQILGILVVEEHIIQLDPKQEAATSKRARQNFEASSPNTALWLELSRLYKSVHEFDVILGIFSDEQKLGTKDKTREAVKEEARGEYKKAVQIYEKALSQTNWDSGEPLEAEIDFWDDSRMECLNNLAQWRDLEAVAVQAVDSSGSAKLDRVWEDDFHQEHYLPYVIRSKLKLMLNGDQNQQPLLSFVDNSMTDEHKKQYLESHYCTELALIYLWQENYDRSRHYTGKAFQSFLQDWCSTTILMESSRKENLHRIQKIVELHEFLKLVNSEKNLSVPICSHLMESWERRLPHQLLDPVSVWDDVVTNRSVYLDKIMKHIRKLGVASDQHQDSMTEEDEQEMMKVKLRLAMADSCREQGNFTLTLRLLRDTHGICKQLNNQHVLAEWIHLYAKTHNLKARNSDLPWKDEDFTNVCTTLDQLDKLNSSPVLKERLDIGLRHYVLKGKGLDTLAYGLFNADSQKELNANIVAKLKRHVQAEQARDNELFGLLVTKSFECLKAAVGQDSDGKIRRGKCVMTVDEANLELAKFCDKYLCMKEEGECPHDFNVSAFPTTLVVCLLNAMKGGLSEAIERFPRLLQIAENHKDVIDMFNKKAAEVPSWMFILWVSQMTALLDKPEAFVVAPLLTRIATDYPQALVYPLRMSSEGLKFGSTPQDKMNQDLVEKLRQLTDKPLINKFISALEQFGQPDIIFKEWCSDMLKLLNNKSKTKEELKKKYTEICDDLLNLKVAEAGEAMSTQTSLSSASAKVEMGEYRKGFAMAVKSEFDKVFGRGGEKLVAMQAKDFHDAQSKIANVLNAHKDKRGKGGPPTKLKEYSPWMANFNPNRNGRELEIPGQYNGLNKPMPEYHVKVAGFDERVMVMKSLRMPKRIVIRGNDERDYPYLVKSGEDLRLDQRIQTLFFIMNKVMNADPACHQRKLHLKTYQVISMTPRLGLIEWMKNTQPLKDFLFEALTEEERRYLESDQGPKKQHINWVIKCVAKKDQHRHQVVYDEVYMKYSYTETVREFRQKQGKVPWNLSRRAVQKLSSSPEAFHVIRSAMITSHAVICICQYVLGIGDRHMSNFMVNLKTGHMIGIDFGHAFGSATQFLPVPELMPFRLTRQLINLNLPLQVKGQLESTMLHVLQALQNDSDLLMSTMDVFVKEPLLDWLNFADKEKQERKGANDAPDEEHTDDKWYPKEKILTARRKLRGDHPCYIMKDELKKGHQKRKAFTSLQEVLLGQSNTNVRAKLPAQGLSVEQQVTALIDQATDPNILGRTWVGWEPWV